MQPSFSLKGRTGINVDIIQTKLLFVRNFTDNAAPSSHNVLFADGSGGTYFSSLYIENIPGFSSYAASTIVLASTALYEATTLTSTFFASTNLAFDNGISSMSSIVGITFNSAVIPPGTYSTIEGLGSLGFVSSPTLYSSITGYAFSTVSSVVNKNLIFNINSNGFFFRSSSYTHLSLTSTGLLGIGLNNDNTYSQMDVSGNTRIRGNLYVNKSILVNRPIGSVANANVDISGSIITDRIICTGNGIFNGNITAASYLTSSDSNLKKDIETYIPSSNAWETLRGVSFKWKKNGAHDIGFIAQELSQSIPEAVGEGENGTLEIEPTKLLPLLVETVKQMRNEIVELKARVKNLESSNTV
jgi:Chaperone of endosialidase